MSPLGKLVNRTHDHGKQYTHHTGVLEIVQPRPNSHRFSYASTKFVYIFLKKHFFFDSSKMDWMFVFMKTETYPLVSWKCWRERVKDSRFWRQVLGSSNRSISGASSSAQQMLFAHQTKKPMEIRLPTASRAAIYFTSGESRVSYLMPHTLTRPRSQQTLSHTIQSKNVSLSYNTISTARYIIFF